MVEKKKLLTVREVAALLEVPEKQVLDWAHEGLFSIHTLNEVYFRFDKEEIDNFKKRRESESGGGSLSARYRFGERVWDFFYFNDFYILALIIIILLLFVIFNP